MIFKDRHYGGSSSWCGTPGHGILEPLALQGEPLHLWYSSHLWVTALGFWFLTRLYLRPSCSSQCGFFVVVVICCGRTVLLISRSFSEQVTLCIVVALVPAGEEMSSRSSYCTIYLEHLHYLDITSFYFQLRYPLPIS